MLIFPFLFAKTFELMSKMSVNLDQEHRVYVSTVSLIDVAYSIFLLCWVFDLSPKKKQKHKTIL